MFKVSSQYSSEGMKETRRDGRSRTKIQTQYFPNVSQTRSRSLFPIKINTGLHAHVSEQICDTS
jgi:hypothetical protein